MTLSIHATSGSRRRWWPAVRMCVALLFVVGVSIKGVGPISATDDVDPGPTPRATCGPGSLPETGAQGRVSAEDVASGRAALGYRCNTEQVSHVASVGGFKVHRYIDGNGHECAYYDTSLVTPGSAPGIGLSPGVQVLDMSIPGNPRRTAALATPAMLAPHESLTISLNRGLLAAVPGNSTTYPGTLDIYDIAGDCRRPKLLSSTPVEVAGHESVFSPDGRTLYASNSVGTITAVDVTNPRLPVPLWAGLHDAHGMNVSDDNDRLYYGDLGGQFSAGLTIVDVSQINHRVTDPRVAVVGHLTWDNVSLPMNAIPVTIRGRDYVVEFDEYSRDPGFQGYRPESPVGAARIIDVSDERNPRLVSKIRLEVHMPESRLGDQQNDPGAKTPRQGYAAHYCSVPQREDPGVLACSFILSGLRVFDIRDPRNPREIAYFNAPPAPGTLGTAPTNWAMAAPAFASERGEIWYTDGNSGFYAVRVTNHAWPWGS